MNKKDIKKYPFGKYNLEPIIVIIKSLVLLIMCSITMFSAIKQVIIGGSNVEEGFALGYSLISSIGCVEKIEHISNFHIGVFLLNSNVSNNLET